MRRTLKVQHGVAERLVVLDQRASYYVGPHQLLTCKSFVDDFTLAQMVNHADLSR